jgi:hypothetical protein
MIKDSARPSGTSMPKPGISAAFILRAVPALRIFVLMSLVGAGAIAFVFRLTRR